MRGGDAYRATWTLSFDLYGALRTLKPAKRVDRLKRRPDEHLPWVDEGSFARGRLLLDTTVYIDIGQGTAPKSVELIVQECLCDHSAVCLSELTYAFGRLDPSHAKTSAALENVEDIIRDVPLHRLHRPNSGLWGEAGIVAGLLSRLGGAGDDRGDERRHLNDALIYLQARALGVTVLTRNIRDFDFLNQVIPDGRIALYRQLAR